MSSIVLRSALVCALYVFASTASAAAQSQQILSCEGLKLERMALKHAPKGVRRISKHVLEVASVRGPQRFVDKPPYDEPGAESVRWRYCGYDARSKAHLIEMTEESAYSGTLLFAETGQQLRAGHTVLFSPNMKEFLAVEQQAGVDGENWFVQDSTGKTLWKGYAGTLAMKDGVEMVVSTFERPRWSKQGQLTARAVCSSSRVQVPITLARTPSIQWNWSGDASCR